MTALNPHEMAVVPDADAGRRSLMLESEGPETSSVSSRKTSFIKRLLMTMGPGLMVCLADTDGSCLITAADSGSEWRYQLLLLQIILIPILYFAQELSVRLALAKGKGLCALLRIEAGKKWAWIVAIPLLIDCVLALISELTVFGQTLLACWDIPLWISSTAFALALVLLALTGSYAVAEKVGLIMGILQVLFFATIFANHPSGSEIWDDLWTFPLTNGNYIKLVTANIGAVIMPWMLAYQQSALCEKGIAGETDADAFLLERIDTGVGSVLTQGVMSAMLVTVAASKMYVGQDIETVDQLLVIFTETMHGALRAKIALTFAICGACIVAAIVVSLFANQRGSAKLRGRFSAYLLECAPQASFLCGVYLNLCGSLGIDNFHADVCGGSHRRLDTVYQRVADATNDLLPVVLGRLHFACRVPFRPMLEVVAVSGLWDLLRFLLHFHSICH